MEIGLILIRWVLAVVFGVAGVAKLADLPGSRQAMRDFGLPERLAAPLGNLLPVAELLVALALLPATTAWLGAWAAAGLLVGFIGGIVVNMARGRAPNCHCFGQLHSAPVGWPTLLRNGVLAVLALTVVAQGPRGVGPGALAWLAAPSGWGYVALIGSVVVLALVAGQSWVVWNLLRQNGRLLLRVEALEQKLGLAPATQSAGDEAGAQAVAGLPIGTPAPAFALSDMAGGVTTLADLLARNKPLLLLFSSPGCGACTDLLPEIATWQRTHAERMTIAIVNRGDADAARAAAEAHGLVDLYMQDDNEVGEAFGSTGTPSAVLIDSQGTIRSPLAAGSKAVRTLVRQGASLAVGQMLLGRRGAPVALDEQAAGGAMIGAALPSISLPDLTGKVVTPERWRGKPTVLLFWNPGCGFCQRMVDELRAWEADRPQHAPQLVLIATGSAEENRAMGLRSTILLDDSFATGQSLGVRGTPSALLIDAQGNIASEVKVGAPNVMALLRPAAAAPQTLNAHPVAA